MELTTENKVFESSFLSHGLPHKIQITFKSVEVVFETLKHKDNYSVKVELGQILIKNIFTGSS